LSLGASYINPKTEAEFIGENLSSHKICNGYGGGGYLMWKLWPNQKVMIDPRYFPYASWFDEWIELKKRNASAQLAKFDCNLWSINYLYSQLVQTIRTSPDWKLVFVGASSAVFVKKSSIQGEWETRTGEDFLHIHDPVRAIRALGLLVNNADYSLALELSESMMQKFRGTQYEDQIIKADAYTQGVLAFSIRDYETAYRWLSKSQVKPAPLTNARLHQHANQFLIQKLMVEGRREDALKFAREAVKMAPKNLLSLFNLGSLLLASSEQRVGPQKWQAHLGEFVSLSKQSPNLISSNIVAIAEAALANGDMENVMTLIPSQQPEIVANHVIF